MVTYFTSSKHVKAFIEKHGMPDVVQVRRTFSDRNAARLWEHKVLKRMNAVLDERFLNRTNNRSVHPEDALKGALKSKPWKHDDPRYAPNKERIHLHREKMLAGMTPEKRRARALKSGATKTAKHIAHLEATRTDFQKLLSLTAKEIWKTRARNTKENSTGRFPVRAVVVDGIEFETLTAAANAHNIHVKSAYNRIKKDTWPNWNYAS